MFEKQKFYWTGGWEKKDVLIFFLSLWVSTLSHFGFLTVSFFLFCFHLFPSFFLYILLFESLMQGKGEFVSEHVILEHFQSDYFRRRYFILFGLCSALVPVCWKICICLIVAVPQFVNCLWTFFLLINGYTSLWNSVSWIVHVPVWFFGRFVWIQPIFLFMCLINL